MFIGLYFKSGGLGAMGLVEEVEIVYDLALQICCFGTTKSVWIYEYGMLLGV